MNEVDLSWKELHQHTVDMCVNEGMVSKEEALEIMRTGRMYYEGVLEFTDDEVLADPRMFENSMSCGCLENLHCVYSFRPDGHTKDWYMISASGFEELVSLATECHERRNAEPAKPGHQQLSLKCEACRELEG